MPGRGRAADHHDDTFDHDTFDHDTFDHDTFDHETADDETADDVDHLSDRHNGRAFDRAADDRTRLGRGAATIVSPTSTAP